MHLSLCNIYFHVLIPYCVMGALLLAAIYHTMLFYFGKLPLLAVYSLYLWACFFHIGFDAATFADPGDYSSVQLITSDFFLILANQLYIRFIASVFGVERKGKGFTSVFYRSTYYVLGLYLLAQIVIRFALPRGAAIGTVLYFTVWSFIIVFSTAWLCIMVYRKPEKFNKFIAAAAFLFILFSLTAIVSSMVQPFDPDYMDKYHMDPFTYTCLGYFVEVLVFSNAIGLKMRQDMQDKLASDEIIIGHQQLLMNNELERQTGIIRSRRKERLAISRDMHDELSNAIAALKFHIGDLRRSAEGSTQLMLQDMENEVASVYVQARSFMHGLHNSLREDDYDLPLFLDSLEAYFRDSLLTFSIAADKEEIKERLSPRGQNFLYMLIKESLGSMMQHAKAANVLISISFEGGSCLLQITHSGAAPGDAQDLLRAGLQEKAAQLSGEGTYEIFVGGGSISASFRLRDQGL